DYEALGTAPGHCHHCHTGRCPVGITTQDPALMARLDPDEAADRVANFLNAMTLELQMIARACGKANVHDLEPEDMRALTLEAAIVTGIPLVGTDFSLRAIFERLAGGGREHLASGFEHETGGSGQ